jgi:hypothetical protein
MFEELIFQKLWIVLPVWLVLYLSDYYLTILGARYHKAGACEHITYGGSYELSPEFQSDVDSLRLFSPKLIRDVFVSSAVIIILWLISREKPEFIHFLKFFIGGYILQEVAILVRHVKNIALFHFAKNHRGISGQLRYEYWLAYKLSGIEFFSFACVFLIVFIFTGSFSFLGGSFITAITGWRHFKMSIKATK